ncbi:MAG: hypothetical protein ACI9MC_002590 [Kiritimatiellia bacterium]|jgi:hypothetical protein
MFDLKRALYSHCEYGDASVPSIDAVDILLAGLASNVVGANGLVVARCGSYLQGATTLPHVEHEFRVHAWFDLPNGHPGYRVADRGLVCFVQACDAAGVYGAIHGNLAWLGVPLDPRRPVPGDDWVAEMVREQGYMTIPGAQWSEQLCGVPMHQVMTWFLARHLESGTNRVIAEERRYRK